MFGSGFRGFGGMGGEPSGMDEEKEPAKDVDNNSLYELLGMCFHLCRGPQDSHLRGDQTSL